MKKAKIMLLAIAVVGVAGGVFAFKAKSSKYILPLYCATTSTAIAGSPACPQSYTTINGNTTLFCTDVLNQTCSVLSTVTTIEP